MKPTRSLFLLASWSCLGHAAALDLPERPATFRLHPDALPDQAWAATAGTRTLRFDSLAALALRERPETRAAWLGIQAEAAPLDAATADYPPTSGRR